MADWKHWVVLFLFVGLLIAPTRNSPERVRDTIRTFPEKSGKPPGFVSPNYKHSVPQNVAETVRLVHCRRLKDIQYRSCLGPPRIRGSLRGVWIKGALNLPIFGIPSFGIPSFGISVFGIPDFGILGFGNLCLRDPCSVCVCVCVFPTFGIPDFGIPVLGIPDFGIPGFGIHTFGISVEFRHP